MMFLGLYPRARLIHQRALRCAGDYRGLSIVPVPGPPKRPDETGRQHSAIVSSLTPGAWYVLEWDDAAIELHRVT